MKFIVLAFVVVVAIATVNGLPAGGKNKNKSQQCSNICPANYDPVCAADLNDSKSSPRLFGNKCVLNSHNCEHNSHLVPVDMNKCSATGGIRLS